MKSEMPNKLHRITIASGKPVAFMVRVLFKKPTEAI
jgi:hypothetical protein